MAPGNHREFATRRSVFVSALVGLASLWSVSVWPADPYSVGIVAPSGKETVLTVPPSGEVILPLVRGSTVAKEVVDLHLSSFSSAAGDSVVVRAAVDGQQADTSLKSIPVSGAFLPLRLSTKDLRPGSQYAGTLVIFVQGSTPARQVLPIVITASAPRDAVLVADRNALPLMLKRPGVLDASTTAQPDAFIHLFDKNRKAPVDGIMVRQEAVTSGSTFDVERHVTFWLDGKPVSLFNAAKPGDRLIPAATQGSLGIGVDGLDAGEYTALLRFHAANSADDDGQKLTLNVKVRDPVLPAILWLAFAGVISFFTTKIVVMVRQHLALRRKVRDLRKPWLRSTEPIVPVVWVRAMLKQSEDLSARFWLTGGGHIDERLNQISGLLPVLQQIDELRKELTNSIGDVFVRRRALAALSRIATRLDAQVLSEVAAARLKAELDALSAWVDAAGVERCYWEAVLPAAKQMIATVALGCFPRQVPAEMQAIVTDLQSDLQSLQQNPNPTMQWKIAFEQKYARLKVLWEHHDRVEYTDLAKLHNEPLSKLFDAADEAAWRRLVAGAPEIVRDGGGGDAPEAYTPLTFRVATPKDPKLPQTYLVSRGLTYEWHFTFKPWLGRETTFSAKSAEPVVVVFAPDAGKLSATVDVKYATKNSIQAATKKPVDIRASDDFSIFGGVERIELISFAVAFGIAVASGLSLFYFRNPAFGTQQDYMNLFLWGIGVDQGKNLIQALQAPAKAATS